MSSVDDEEGSNSISMVEAVDAADDDENDGGDGGQVHVFPSSANETSYKGRWHRARQAAGQQISYQPQLIIINQRVSGM